MKIFWCDAETGGLDPQAHDITQLAFILDVDGKVVEEVELLMRPDDPKRVTAEALAVTHQTLEQVMAHPLTQRQGYEALTAIMGKYVDKFNRQDKMVWMGQNPRFDQDFTRELWRKQGDRYFGSWWMNSPVDLIALAVAAEMRGHLQGLANHKLGTIAEALGVKFEAHRALDDVRATRECTMRIIGLIPLAGKQKALA